MDIESFNKLSLEEKGRTLDIKGTYLGTRAIYNKSAIHLYKLNDFFAERFYDPKTRELQQIIVTTLDEILDNYIDLREVYLSNKQIRPPQK